MNTATKIIIGIGGLLGLGLSYEYVQSKKARPQIGATAFLLHPLPGGPVGSTYGDLGIWNADVGGPANAPKLPAHSFVASIQAPQQPIPEAGWLGIVATWLQAQFMGGNRVFFCQTPVATTQVGIAFYRFTVNDPSPSSDAVEIVKG